MVNQTGRCNNLELCTVAVSQRLQTVPEGEPFVCVKCGEPLAAAISVSSPGRRKASIAIQAVVLLLGISAIAWKLSGPNADFAGLTGFVAALSGLPSATQPSGAAGPVPASTLVEAAPPQVVAAMSPGSDAAASPALPPSEAAEAVPESAPILTAAAVLPPGPSQTPVTATAAAAAARRQALPSSVLLRLAGSDAVTPKLVRRLASSYLALIGDTSITATPGNAPRLVEVSGLQTGQREIISIAETSTADGFSALMRGTADMAVSNRRITAAEAERLASVGDLTLAAHEHTIAVQGIAIIVSPTNRVASLTVNQVRGILTGKIGNWAEVGGVAAPIKLQVVAVPEGGGDTPQDAIVAADTVSPAAIRSATEQVVSARVLSDRDSVGVVTVSAAGAARILAIADGSAAPVSPNELTLAAESYPFSQRLYLYGVNASNGFVRRFADYVTSANGQAAVEAAGYTSLAIKTEAAAIPDVASDRYKQLVQGATRMSVDFRFQPGSVDLDSRGARDMDRVIAYLKSQRVSASKIVLAAFADNSGQPATNQAVSQRRAEVVASALTRGGFTPGKIASFGAELPVADNGTAEGRERNRRVEVYLVP